MKIFGVSIQLSKNSRQKPVSATGEKKRATGTIRKQPKREVPVEINHIKIAIQMAQNADDPDRSKLLQIYRYILRDGRLKSLMRDAKIEVLSEPWMIYMNGQPDEATTELMAQRWMTHLVEYILESEFYGYSVCEMDWSEEGRASVTLLDREYVSIDRQWILIEGTINGPYLPYGDIAWNIDLLEFGKREDLGTLLEAAYNVIWKLYARSDWSRASEKFGMPILAVKANTNNDAELDDLEARAANFGSDGYIVTQQGDEVEIVERTGQRMHDIYFDSIKLSNEENTILINGQVGTTDQKAFVGAAEVQERKMDKITTARLQMVADEFNEKVVPYLIYKGILKEGHTLNYPELIRQKERRRTGMPLATDPKPQSGEDKGKDEKPEAKDDK